MREDIIIIEHALMHAQKGPIMLYTSAPDTNSRNKAAVFGGFSTV